MPQGVRRSPSVAGFIFASLLGACGSANVDGVTLFKAGAHAKAHDLLVQQANAGDVEAQRYLATQFYAGLGVPRNLPAAAVWYERAARGGDPSAQLSYGMMLMNGQGAPQDFALAFGWLQAAEDGGSARARIYLAALDDNVTVDQRARVTAEVRKLLGKNEPESADTGVEP